MKNYLEHEEKVKYMDGILRKDKNWQWFIDCIEENYDINEIKSWDDYLNQKMYIEQILSYFLKIAELNHDKPKFDNKINSEIYELANFFQGKKEIAETKSELSSNASKILFLIIWTTKILNQSNKTNYLTDIRVFIQSNIFILIDVEELSMFEEDIIEYIDSLLIININKPKQIFQDNINLIEHKPNITFLESKRNDIINANAFYFTKFNDTPENITWEETWLLDMLQISFRNREIIPLFGMGENIQPNTREWTIERLRNLKNFFNNDIADFIIETIMYVLYEKIPTQITIDTHINLITEQLEKEELFIISSYSSFQIISYLFEDGKCESDYLADLMKKIHTVNKTDYIKLLQKSKIPISKDQKSILRKYYENCFQSLDNITEDITLLEYLNDEDISKSIDNNYFNKLIILFNKHTDEMNGMMYPVLFVDYMLFLVNLKENKKIDTELISSEMIRIQELWENNYNSFCKNEMQTFSQKIELDISKIEELNQEILDNIFTIANACIITKDEDYISEMQSVSSAPLLLLTSKINIDRKFPIKEEHHFSFERHDIDVITIDIVNDIKERYGYKFINSIENSVYVKALHDTMKHKTVFYFNLFNRHKELYEKILKNLENQFQLIDYDDDISLAHLTQLFPIIEIKIKELGKMYNVFPYKEKKESFMQDKDPSSILRILLKMVYKETQSFEVAPDLLFIYNYLYNSNSFNVRNECIHGRDYLSGGQLVFALKISLSCLNMLLERIAIIENNYE